MELFGSFLLTLTVALSLAEGPTGPPAPATAGLVLSGLVSARAVVHVMFDLFFPQSLCCCFFVVDVLPIYLST